LSIGGYFNGIDGPALASSFVISNSVPIYACLSALTPNANAQAPLVLIRCGFVVVQQIHNNKQGIHRHQTSPQYHNAASHALPYGPLRPNVTSSIKPEVHNESQSCQTRTEPRPQGICTKIS